ATSSSPCVSVAVWVLPDCSKFSKRLKSPVCVWAGKFGSPRVDPRRPETLEQRKYCHMTTHYSVDGDVDVTQLDNPPVNGLGLATRESLVATLHRGLDDPKVSAIVITGGGGVYCA